MTQGASALDPTMTALITTLRADATFVGLCAGGIYDAPPQGVTYPYARITIREDPAGVETFGRMGQEIDVRIQIFDKDGDAEGTARIDAIVGRLADFLHHRTITVAGWIMPLFHYIRTIDLPNLTDADKRSIRTKQSLFRGLLEAA